MTKNALYAMLWVFVGLVAATDVYWSIINQEQLYQIELNPLGKFILKVSSGDVAPFMGLKVAGTVIVLGILTVMYNYKRQWAWICMIAMCVVQIFVLWMLLKGDLNPVRYYDMEDIKMKTILYEKPIMENTDADL
tara:strand:- start:2213 stop:2617 length:405 start_codon:yes stop_codon:yes gene_type:complete